MIMPITHNTDSPSTTSIPIPRKNAGKYDTFDHLIIVLCVFVFFGVLVYSMVRFIAYIKTAPDVSGWSDMARNIQELSLPNVPTYTPRATRLDLGTFDKDCNLIPTQRIHDAMDAGIIYTANDEELIPYPDAVHARERSNSLPSYKSSASYINV